MCLYTIDALLSTKSHSSFYNMYIAVDNFSQKACRKEHVDQLLENQRLTKQPYYSGKFLSGPIFVVFMDNWVTMKVKHKTSTILLCIVLSLKIKLVKWWTLPIHENRTLEYVMLYVTHYEKKGSFRIFLPIQRFWYGSLARWV